MPLSGRAPAHDGATAKRLKERLTTLEACRADGSLAATASIWKLVALLSPGDLNELSELKSGMGPTVKATTALCLQQLCLEVI